MNAGPQAALALATTLAVAGATGALAQQAVAASGDPPAVVEDVIPVATPEAPAAATDPPADQPAMLDDVTVTSSRRIQHQHEIPYSVQAIDDKAIRENDLRTFQDYLGRIPGVSFSTTGGGRSDLHLRGISSPSVGRSTVGLYLDEMPLAFAGFQPDVNLYDMERVEVLKGPQGTLYGEGALGGALKLITAKPNLYTFAASGEGTYSTTAGGGHNGSGSAMVNVPLLADTLALRMVYGRRAEGGWLDNPRLDTTDVNSGDTGTGRAQLKWAPASSFDVLLTYLNQRASYAAEPFIDYGSSRLDQQNRAFNEPYTDKLWGANGAANWSTDYGTLTFSNSVLRRSLKEYLDLEQTAAMFDPGTGNTVVVALDQLSGFKVTSHELRFVSAGWESLDWVVGLFYKDRRQPFHAHVPTPTPIVPVVPGAALPPPPDVVTLYDNVVATSDKEGAVFGEATYRLGARSRLTLGGRYSREKSKVRSDLFVYDSGQQPTWTADAAHGAFVPRAAFSYDVSADSSAYITLAKGYRSGGANFQVNPDMGDPLTYRPDNVINYEIGHKADWWERRMATELAVYHLAWSDIQTFQRSEDGSRSWTTNGGRAGSDGLELTVAALPIEGWDISAGWALLRARYRDPVPDAGVAAGDRLPFAPTATYNFASGYRLDLGAGFGAFGRAEYQHTGARLSSARDPLPAYAIVNVRAGASFQRATLTAFVKNATDRAAVLDTLPAGLGVSVINTPRIGGLTLSLDFD